MTTDTYDVIVIGGGPAGEVAAQFAIAGSDRTAAIIEAELLGGECSYWACMPSKALLRPIEIAATARNLDGVDVADGIDTAKLLARRDTWTSDYSDAGQRTWAEGIDIDVISGRGRLDGDKTVVVTNDGTERTVTARLAVILGTGSTATVPGPYTDLAPWTSRDATGIREVPESIIVVGGGVVACEAATWLAALGSKVTMAVRGKVLGTLDDFVGEAVVEGLKKAGVDVRTGVSITAPTRENADDAGIGVSHGGPVTVTVDGEPLTAAEILVAAGRKPAVDGLGLDTVGIDDPSTLSAPDPGGHDWLYAVGDVSFGPMLTHWGKYQARLVGQQISARAEGRTPPQARDDVPVPQAVFTDPQVGSTGLTAKEADEKGLRTTVVSQPITAASGIGLLRDDATGTAQLVIDDDTRTLLGATFVGPETGELIHAATIAIVGKVTVDDLWHAVPSYPTGSEIWLRLLEKYFGY
ncbi:dihydrolipoyl dehydrogenase family protein [Williamsia phyllosphaerae]|uniref:Oxidoreductase n=1 Tax=Williamsia phyllosphaerae TaxID=885042 RepID=A0ABQ1URV7_9NOCA|nr:NAD(P)/FAD-dependent oxidoreductase [Williamsia phyllosphaerae]GGF23549.1 oxidoreductase [Williamsia phyllosphaerae]